MYCLQMPMQQLLKIQNLSSPIKEYRDKNLPAFGGNSFRLSIKRNSIEVSAVCPCQLSNFLEVPVQRQKGGYKGSKIRVSQTAETLKSGDENKRRQDESSDTDGDEDDDDDVSAGKGVKNDPYLMDAEERREWRRSIRDVMKKYSDINEERNSEDKRTKMQKLLEDYPFVVEDDDPDWPEDADGWGFNLGQFFDKITMKNDKKDDDEIVWQDDNYICPIKDIKMAEWEEAVFKDISLVL